MIKDTFLYQLELLENCKFHNLPVLTLLLTYTTISILLVDTPILEARWGNDDFPMFRTGKGKPVNVSQSSITKAAAILEGVDTEKGVLLDSPL